MIPVQQATNRAEVAAQTLSTVKFIRSVFSITDVSILVHARYCFVLLSRNLLK